MSIERRIRAAAADGMEALTVFHNGGMWQASATKDKTAWSVRTDPDPVVAVNDALARWHDGEGARDPLGEAVVARTELTRTLQEVTRCIRLDG